MKSICESREAEAQYREIVQAHGDAATPPPQVTASVGGGRITPTHHAPQEAGTPSTWGVPTATIFQISTWSKSPCPRVAKVLGGVAVS